MTWDRYDELVKLRRDWVATMSSAQRRLGDAAMEIEPMRSYEGANPSGHDDLFTVSEGFFAVQTILEPAPLVRHLSAVDRCRKRKTPRLCLYA